MNNKKIFYASALLAFLIVGGAAIFIAVIYTLPLTMESAGIMDPIVLNNSYLAQESDVIVIGEVKEILPSRWTTEDGKKSVNFYDERIYTDVIIEVGEYLKNPQPTEEITVRTMGGKVGNDRIIYEDEAEFEPDEKVLLFLTKEEPYTANLGSEHFRVRGLMHGKFTIEDGQAIRPEAIEGYRTIPLQELLETIEKSNCTMLNVTEVRIRTLQELNETIEKNK